jgi:hypothetical protein
VIHLSHQVEVDQGEVVMVYLEGSAANVMLLDGVNYIHYKNGRAFRYRGGYFDKPAVLLKPPRPGTWHVVVDLGGHAGRLKASVSVEPE